MGTDSKPQAFIYSNGLATAGEHAMRIISLKQHHVVNQPAIVEVTVVPEAANVKGVAHSVQEVYDMLALIKKGDEVIASYDLSSTSNATEKRKGIEAVTTPVFTGRFLGWGPTWVGPTSLQLKFWAIHPLGMLDWASSFVDPVHGSGFDDYSLPAVIGKDDELVPYMKGPYKPEDVTKDLWKKVIKPELIRICRMTRFGEVNAELVAKYLEDSDKDKTDGSEQPLSLQIADPMRVIIDVRKTLMTSAPGRMSLWDRLVALADTYKFAILCRGLDFSIAPVLPALGGPGPQFILTNQEFFKKNEMNALVRDITQSVGMARGSGGATNFFDVVGKKRSVLFRQPPADENAKDSGNPGNTIEPIPKFLDAMFEPFFKTGNTLGLKDEVLFASGYKVDDKAKELSTLSKQYNEIPQKDIDAYTDVTFNEQSFDGPTMMIVGNVTFDVSPGNTVAVEPPLYYVQGMDVVQVYTAMVWSVTNVMDARSRTSGTYAILSHVRGTIEQAGVELDRHPLYDKRWVSAPLIDLTGYSRPAENA